MPFLNALFPFVKSWIDKRATRQEAQIEIEKIRAQGQIERAKTLATVEADYDLEVLRQSQYTWADDILIYVTIAIVGSAFIPEYATYTLEGFKVLAQMPEWFQWVVLALYIRVLGIRFLSSNIKLPFIGKTGTRKKS